MTKVRPVPLVIILAATTLGAFAMPACCDPPPAAKPARQTAGKEVPAREIAALLIREDFPQHGKAPDKMKLKDVLQAVSDTLSSKSGCRVVCLLDTNAFKAENEEVTSEQMLGEEVDLSDLPCRRTLGAVLRHALDRLPSRNATYLVRRGCVEITTLTRASVLSLLNRKILATFADRPLEEVLHALSDQTGATIAVDGRAGDKLRTPVSATFLNDASLGGALRLLTDMAGLRVVVVEGAIYVTTPRNARRLRKELEHPLVPPSAQLALPGPG